MYSGEFGVFHQHIPDIDDKTKSTSIKRACTLQVLTKANNYQQYIAFICHKITNSNITNVSYFLSEKPSVPPSSYCLFLVFIGSSHFTVQATQVMLMGVDVFGHWLTNISLSYQMALKVLLFRSCFATEMERYICHTNLIVTTNYIKRVTHKMILIFHDYLDPRSSKTKLLKIPRVHTPKLPSKLFF